MHDTNLVRTHIKEYFNLNKAVRKLIASNILYFLCYLYQFFCDKFWLYVYLKHNIYTIFKFEICKQKLGSSFQRDGPKDTNGLMKLSVATLLFARMACQPLLMG